ncbi:MAG TPA: manganese efflux pump MntP family protein [Bacteroidales bacterium]|nr:manganese efflux pump MntP family protein [Bacteroidales bacterium]HQI44657.1 manganese efflux pump MntP family protein [Bacteroidales bacterium]
MTQEIITVIFIAIGLSMDALAVSLCFGALSKSERKKVALKAGIFFGGFQALMPLIGWVLGYYLKDYIEKFDHWIAFLLLVFIGLKMILEAIKRKGCPKGYDYSSLWVMLTLSFATSIDALAVGLSIALLNIPIILSIAIIGIITFIISYGGVVLGGKVNRFLGNKVEIIGGIILTLIGFKILFDHLLFQ